MIERTGQCLCGDVRYRVTGEPLICRVCWCRDCQHLSANGTVNAIFPAAAITLDGPVAHFTSPAASGHAIRRTFCPRCGSHLLAGDLAHPDHAVVRIGTLDDPSSIPPTLHMWTTSAPTWACLDPSLTRFARQPDATD